VLRYETQLALSEAIHSHGEQLQLESAGPASMQMFILLPPLFSIMFHVPGPAGGDVVAASSEIGSTGKRIAQAAAASPRQGSAPRPGCPDPACCSLPPADLATRWNGLAWPSARVHSHPLAAMPPGMFPGVDDTEVLKFLERHGGA
jgi:hypothetical protein